MSGTSDGGNGGGTEDKKPDQTAHINLKVKGQVSLLLSLFTNYAMFQFWVKFVVVL